MTGQLDMSRETLFQTLVEGLLPDVFAYAMWLTKNKAEAEDIAQESLIRAWRFVGKLRDQNAVKPWLLTIVRREFIRVRRKQARLAEVSLEEPKAFLEQIEGQADVLNVEQLAVREALAQLEDDYREPLVLQVLMGYSTNEIATIMGLKQGAVLTRVFRARKQLKVILEKNNSALKDKPRANALNENVHELY